MALNATQKTQMYQFFSLAFGAAPGVTYMDQLDAALNSGMSLVQVVEAFSAKEQFTDAYPKFWSFDQFANAFVNNNVGSFASEAVKAAAVADIIGALTAGWSRGKVIAQVFTNIAAKSSTDADWGTYSKVMAADVAYAQYYTEIMGGKTTDMAILRAVIANTGPDSSTATADIANALSLSTSTPKTVLLTAGFDTGSAFTGSNGNDTFIAGDVVTVAGIITPWTIGDAIDGSGGAGDVFNVISNFGISNPVAATVKGIETINLTGGNFIAVDASGFTGLTALNASTTSGSIAVKAAATTAVTAISTSGEDLVALTGGLSQTITSAGGGVSASDSAGAINVTSSGQAGNIIQINGGSTVVLNSKNVTTGSTVVGDTSAATGAVAVTTTGVYESGINNTLGLIAVTGGTTVAVTVNSGITAAQIKTASNTTNNATETLSAVTVTGNASTTAVTVTQSAAVTKVNSTTGTDGKGKIGVTNGAVVITDANAASETAAGTITAVTLVNFGSTTHGDLNPLPSTINSGALNTINLSGTGTALTVINGALTTPTVKTQALNLNGLTATNVTLDEDITTLNLASSTAASKIEALTASKVTALNISGDAALTLTEQTIGTSTVTVTNTAGVTLGTALAKGTSFTGGAGPDTITLTADFTKASTMGDGNDTVTYAPQGKGGSVAAGAGTGDKIIMTDAQADAADLDAVFNNKFTGFEVLELSTISGAYTIDLSGINGISNVRAGAGGGGTVTLNNMASGGTFTLTGASEEATVGVTNAATNTSTDVINFALAGNKATNYGTLTAAAVETVNIAANDSVAAGSAAAVNTLVLVATGATSVVVTGNNGLTLTNIGNKAITSFDASGVVGNGNADKAANLAVNFTSATTSGAVSIIGGAGSDTLTGVGAIDTILGGAGDDRLNGGAGADVLTGGEGADVITGGLGNDTVDLTETTAKGDTIVFATSADNNVDTITGFAAGSSGTDTAQLANGATSAAAAATALFATTASTLALTTGATAFVLGASTKTNHVIEIATTLSSFGNLGALGVVDGTELLKALSSNNVAASSITSTTDGENFYLVAYQGGNAYLYQVTDTDTSVVAANIALVGVFNGIAGGAFESGDFTFASLV